jgi:5-methylthioadenosine/S-adenosylhomocysteine deaminase
MRGLAADWTLAEYWQGVRAIFGPLYTPEDVHAANLLGAYEAIDAGITTLVDFAHIMNSSAHADAAIQALADAGLRSVFCHGTPTDRDATEWYVQSEIPHSADVRRIREQYFTSDDQLLTLALAARGPQNCTLDTTAADWTLARELAIPITVHAGSGKWGAVRPIEQLQSRSLLRDDTVYVHCNSLSDRELDLIAESGGRVSISPEVEMHMGHGYPATGRLLEAGLRPSLGVDVVTGVGGDLFATMRVCLAAERARVNEAALNAGEPVDRLDVTSDDVFSFATIEGARAFGLDSKIGTISPGKEADIVLLSTDDPNMHSLNNPIATVALAATPANVDTVIVGGTILKQNGRLCAADMDSVRNMAETARDRLFERARVPIGHAWSPDVADSWKP